MGEDTHWAEVGVEQRDVGVTQPNPISGPASWSSYEFSVFILAIFDFKQKHFLWSRETSQQVKTLVGKLDNLIPGPGPHMTKGKNWHMQVILWPTHPGPGRGLRERGRKEERESTSEFYQVNLEHQCLVPDVFSENGFSINENFKVEVYRESWGVS